MDHLDEITVEELQRALDEVERKKPTQRLLAAITYKNGVTQKDIAEWYGVDPRTIYNWLMRLEGRPLTHAVQDDQRSGRPRKLTDEQQKKLDLILHQSPTEIGYSEPAWTTSLLRDWLKETFDVEYSLASCRRLMKDAGLSYEKPRHTADEVEEEDREAFHEEIKKKRETLDATVVCIDHTKKSAQVEARAAWFPRGTRPSVELSGQRDWTCLLGVISDDGDRFRSRFDEYVTADHAKHFSLAL